MVQYLEKKVSIKFLNNPWLKGQEKIIKYAKLSYAIYLSLWNGLYEKPTCWNLWNVLKWVLAENNKGKTWLFEKINIINKLLIKRSIKKMQITDEWWKKVHHCSLI